MTPLIPGALLASTSPALQDAVTRLQDRMRLNGEAPGVHHTIHGGIYSRTICMPRGAAMTGALLKVPTTVVVSGAVWVSAEDGPTLITGHTVLLGMPGRKQAWAAAEDSTITMLMPTSATTVEEAERQFTDEWHLLLASDNDTFIFTGV